jgi:hypothetical protein
LGWNKYIKDSRAEEKKEQEEKLASEKNKMKEMVAKKKQEEEKVKLEALRWKQQREEQDQKKQEERLQRRQAMEEQRRRVEEESKKNTLESGRNYKELLLRAGLSSSDPKCCWCGYGMIFGRGISQPAFLVQCNSNSRSCVMLSCTTCFKKNSSSNSHCPTDGCYGTELCCETFDVSSLDDIDILNIKKKMRLQLRGPPSTTTSLSSSDSNQTSPSSSPPTKERRGSSSTSPTKKRMNSSSPPLSPSSSSESNEGKHSSNRKERRLQKKKEFEKAKKALGSNPSTKKVFADAQEFMDTEEIGIFINMNFYLEPLVKLDSLQERNKRESEESKDKAKALRNKQKKEKKKRKKLEKQNQLKFESLQQFNTLMNPNT